MKARINLFGVSALLLFLVCDTGLALTIQGERAHVKTVGGLSRGAWNLWANGEWADFFHFPEAGRHKVRVLCFGSPAKGVWPAMALSVDGSIIKTVTVADDTVQEYIFEFEAEVGDGRIGVSFLNDARTDTEDRNLYIVSMSIEPLNYVAEPSMASEPTWRTQWVARQTKLEESMLTKAAKAVEDNRKTDATVLVTDEAGRSIAGAGIVVELMRHDFLFGCNIYLFDRFGTTQENELYKERFRQIFNYATTGFYWRRYELRRGEPRYDFTDKVVDWCFRNDIQLKGHPLLWAKESGIPEWSKEQPVAELQKQRIVDIMTRYAGKIDFWEVVNEPGHLPGIEIDAPYRWAREVNPKADLIVNDYSVMANGYLPFFVLLQKARDRGVPFDGIGIQAHEPRTMRFPLEQVWKVLDQYAVLGKRIHITEFTPPSAGQEITGSHITGKWDEAAQADYAAKFYTVCFAHPAVAAITWWDLCDNGAWNAGGGLLRKDLSLKPAYAAIQKLIHAQWVTKTAGKTDADGKFSFRGFCGKYAVRITRDGKTIEQFFHIGKQEQNRTTISCRF